jgi:hypothetical protein
LIEDFGLYPAHIIDNPAQLTASVFIERIESIVATFDKRKEEIKRKVNSCAQAYIDFLNESITD